MREIRTSGLRRGKEVGGHWPERLSSRAFLPYSTAFSRLLIRMLRRADGGGFEVVGPALHDAVGDFGDHFLDEQAEV